MSVLTPPPDARKEPHAVEVSGLVKTFGTVRAVDGLDLVVPRGTVLGLLGPNGAGKTTALRILSTLIRPDAGVARVFGHDVTTEAAAVRARISVTGQFASVDDDLDGWENLIIQGRLRGLAPRSAHHRAEQLLEAFDLADAGRRPVRTWSGGMKRRLDIALGVLITPDLLFLDEPTTGLDPRSRAQVWETVRHLVGAGSSVLLTTQYLDEADQLADRIVVIDRGTVVAEDTPGRLKASVGMGVLHVELADPAVRSHAVELLERLLGAPAELDADPAALRVRIDDAEAGHGRASMTTSRVLSELARAGVELVAHGYGRPSLDEVFLALTGRGVEADPHQDNENEEVPI